LLLLNCSTSVFLVKTTDRNHI